MGKTKKTEPADAAKVRRRLIEVLADYNRLQANMAEMENMFLTHVLMPSYQLRDTVRRRELLEEEYKRIRERIKDNYYSSSAEVEEDVRNVLRRSTLESSQKSLEEAEELVPKGPTAGLEVVDHDFAPDDREKDRIIREFKRTVIPRIHADTSDTPFEEYQTVYAAYKKRDYLMMKAFIIQYQGEIVPKPGEGAESFAKRAEKLVRESGEVLEKLEQRLADLKQNMTALELEEQEKVILQIRNQNKEILRAIYEEAEKILRLQKMLEELIKTPYMVH
jgi:uncharacterized protein (UPF0335 family)